eukprot:gene26442-35097_t
MTDISFPRGLPLIATSHRGSDTRKADKEEDVIFGVKRARRIEAAADSKGSKKTKSQSSTAADSVGLVNSSVTVASHLVTKSNNLSKIGQLKMSTFVEGSTALGFVLQITDSKLVISLPGGFTGIVQYKEISDTVYSLLKEVGDDTDKLPPIESLVSPQQMVRCYILGTATAKAGFRKDNHKKSIALSMRQSLLHRGLAFKHFLPGFPIQGCVSSKEDHGYLISVGVNGTNCFLPVNSVPSTFGELTIGRPIECVTTAVNEAARTASLRAHPKSVREATVRSTFLSFNGLVPGMMFNAIVDSIVENGIIVLFLNVFYGAISSNSLAGSNYGNDWKDHVKIGDILFARIIFIDYASKNVRLSCRPHIVDMTAPTLPALGDTVSDLKVVAVIKNLGVLLTNSSETSEAAIVTEEVVAEGEEKVAEKGDAAQSGKKKAAAAAYRKAKEADLAVLKVFIHKSSLAKSPSFDAAEDEKDDTVISPESIAKVYKVGDVVNSLRVLGYNLVEGWALGSNIQKVVEGNVLHSSSIKLGDLYNAEVVAVKDVGLSLMIDSRVQAFCPISLISDAATMDVSKLKKKFKVGQVIRVRVWQKEGNSIVVTNKKSIVELEDSKCIYSYDEATVGKQSTGSVRDIKPEGIALQFFNKVRGFVPMRVLMQQGVLDPAESFRVGQSLNVVVIGKFAKKKSAPSGDSKGTDEAAATHVSVYLGLDIASNVEDVVKLLKAGEFAKDGEKGTETDNESYSADFVAGTIFKINDDGETVAVRLDDGREAKMLKSHIGDFTEILQKLLVVDSSSGDATGKALFDRAFGPGYRIENAVVLSAAGRTVHISMKPLLVAALKQSLLQGISTTSEDKTLAVPSTLSTTPLGKLAEGNEEVSVPQHIGSLTPGQVVVGYIHKVESFGVIVRFRGTLSALAPRPNIADRFISTAVNLFNVGDSIRCVVQRVDLSTERAFVTLKPSIVTPSSGDLNYLRLALREKYLIAEMVASESKKLMPDWKKYSVGTVVNGTVSSIEEFGVVLLASDNITIMLAKISAQHALQVGDAVDVCVLDVDFENSVLDVSLDTTLVAASERTVEKKKKGKSKKKGVEGTESTVESTVLPLPVGDVVSGTILLVKDKYLVVSTACKRIGYVMIADFHSPKPDVSAYSINSSIELKVLAAGSNSKAFPHNCIPIFTELQQDTSNANNRKVLSKLQLSAQEGDKKKASHKEKGQGGFIDSLRVGQLSKWVVSKVTPTEIFVIPLDQSNIPHGGPEIVARVHLSNAIDSIDGRDDLAAALKASKKAKAHKSANEITSVHPFAGISAGSVVLCRLLQIRNDSKPSDTDHSESERVVTLYLALVKSIQKDNDDVKEEPESDSNKKSFLVQAYGKHSLKKWGMYAVVVTKVENGCCLVSFSPYLSTFLSFVDVSNDVETSKKFSTYCHVGLRLVVLVTDIQKSAESDSKFKIVASRSIIEHLTASTSLDLSLNRNVPEEQRVPSKPIEKGMLVCGVLNLSAAKIPRPPAFLVTLPNRSSGRLCATELCDAEQWQDLSTAMSGQSDSLPNGLKNASLLTFRVLAVQNGIVEVSLRASRMVETIELERDPLPVEGSIVRGFVSNTSGKGCFLRLSHAVTGHVLMKDLSDEFIDDPAAEFPMGKLVHARVLSVDQVTSQVKLSMKASALVKDPNGDRKDLEKLHVGDSVSGVVKRVTNSGVFVSINDTSIVGLARRNVAISDAKSNKLLSDEYTPGDIVRAKILAISKSTLKVSLGLKSKFFKNDSKSSVDVDDDDDVIEAADENDDDEESVQDQEEDVEEEDEGEDGASVEELAEADDSDSEIEAMIKAASLPVVDDDDDDDEMVVDVIEEEPEVVEVVQKSKKDKKRKKNDDSDGRTAITDSKRIKVPEETSEGDIDYLSNIFDKSSSKIKVDDSALVFCWDDFMPTKNEASNNSNEKEDDEKDSDDDDDEEEDGDDSGGKSSKLRTRQKAAMARRKEDEIRARENALVDGTLVPESKDDFERLVIASPNSSFVWIQYMAFYLQSADVETARSIAQRALRTIGFREETEKYNVWIALLNMEYKYGTTESLEKAFSTAVAESKGKLIYLAMAETYETSGNNAGAEAVYSKALKKPQYKKSKKVWAAYHQFKIRSGDVPGAKEQLSRSMQSLSRHKHIYVISKYALAEFEFGSADRARVLFEELLNNYPKRSDLWHLYVDKEVKMGNISQARRLFERMAASKSSDKNMKLVFKKYLKFEVTHGTPILQDQRVVRLLREEDILCQDQRDLADLNVPRNGYSSVWADSSLHGPGYNQ